MENKDLEFALEHSRNIGVGSFPDVFPIDYGMDFHLETMPDVYPEIANYETDGSRRVTLSISTFMDVCSEAMHWYGKLKADGIRIIREEYDETSKKNHKYILGGYICKEYAEMENVCKYKPSYEFEIVRPITEEDIKKHPERFEENFLGFQTDAFFSVDEIIEIAKKVVATRFSGWKFVIEK